MKVRGLYQDRRFQQWALAVLIFLLAFLPRAIYPISRPIQWYERAISFTDRLLEGNWAATYQRYHPGVTTMWLSGIGLKYYAWRHGLSSEQLLGDEPLKPGMVGDAVTAGVIPLTFFIALGIALCYLLLIHIAGPKIALISGGLLALDPFYIAHSKVLHTDALLATFMVVSALFLLSYLQRSKQLHLCLSGVFAGLAFLTKSPSYFLIPYAAMAVGVHRLMELRLNTERGDWTWICLLWKIFRVLLVWGGVAAVIFILLWPAMWVEPLEVLRRIGNRIIFHIETPHYNPQFFNGRITSEDPGLFFYLATLAWKTTSITLPMSLLSLVLLASRFGQDKLMGLLVAYLIFFVIQMGISARKELAYLLPAFPALDIVAAFGLGFIAKAMKRMDWLSSQQKRAWLSMAFIALVLAIQAGLVLPTHPHYGAHHNALLGGTRTAKNILPLQDQGEGIDLAVKHLNSLPQAPRARAAIHRRGDWIFQQDFAGLTTNLEDPWVNYRIYFVNQVMRQLHSEKWTKDWQADQQREPLWTIAFDGVTYVWVYGAPPEKPVAEGLEYELNYHLGKHIVLERARLSDKILTPGDTLSVALVWESDGEVEDDYTVFCHILSTNGQLVAQKDGPPLYGVRPTQTWRDGEILEDSYWVTLDDDLASGNYELSVGMYDAETMERLPAYDADGQRWVNDRIVLDSIHLRAVSTSK